MMVKKRMLSLVLALTMVLSMSVSALGVAHTKFIDVENHWASEEIDFMAEKKVVNGYEDGTFKPDNNMTKVEFYKVINSLMGYEEKVEVKFKDVKSSDWFYNEVAKALAKGYIIEGEVLNPNELITRQEVARIIGFVYDLEKSALEVLGFKDHVNIELSARGYVGALKEKGYIQGYPDGTFGPKNNITRAEVVKMLFNVYKNETITEIVKVEKPKPSKPASSGGSGGGGGGGGGGGSKPDPKPILVTSVSLKDNVTSVVYGEELQLKAKVEPSNATNKNITWTIEDGTGLASISEKGLLKAIDIGTVTVTATAVDGSNVSDQLVINIISEGKIIIEEKESGIIIEAGDSDVLDPNTELIVEEVRNEGDLDRIFKIISGEVPDKQIVSLFDIKLSLDGVEIQPEGNVKVRIKITEEMKEFDDLQVVHIYDGATIIPSTIEGDYIVFETDHFSNYAVVGKAKPIEPIDKVITGEEAEAYVKAQDFGYGEALDYEYYNVGFQLQSLTEDNGDEIYSAIEQIEVKLFAEGIEIANRVTVTGGVDKLKEDDKTYGGYDGQLSAAFKQRDTEESNEYWKSSAYDFAEPDRAEIRISVRNVEGGTTTYVVENTNLYPTKPIEPTGDVAEIGEVKYKTLEAAVDAVKEGQSIKLLANASGNGIVVPSGSNFTLDLNGKTYTVDGETVGSPNTKTNGFQLLKDSNITIENGTITTNKAKILIQKYCDLTLDNVDLIGGSGTEYVLSNNNGKTTLEGDTTITAVGNNKAFDVCVTNYYPDGAQVIVDTTGTIDGKVEYGLWGGIPKENKATLTINNGVFKDELIIGEGLTDDAKKNIVISGGTFNSDPSDYCANGYKAKEIDGVWKVTEL